MPPRDKDLPDLDSKVHYFGATNMPHPTEPGSDKKVQIDFIKYDNGVITFQITGPVEQVAVGSRLNKYGQQTPEKYTWSDPRSPEAVLRRADGTFTTKGRGLYAYCVGEKGGGIWPLIDKQMLDIAAKNITNPWQ
jgi:hypothetical protein